MHLDFPFDFDDDDKPLPLEVDPYDLPKDMEPVFRAEAIDLSYCNLTELPEWLRECRALKSLDLSGNRLTTLPAWLTSISQLQTLNWRDNNVVSAEEWMEQLSELKELDLSENPLVELPHMPNLEALNVSACGPKPLSTWNNQFAKLRSLDLSYNSLDEVPKWAWKCNQLRTLKLDGNGIKVLPDWMECFDAIETLTLSFLNLSEIPSWMSTLGKIRNFSAPRVDGQQLHQVATWTELKNLNLNSVTGHHIPAWVRNLSELRSFSFSSMFLEEVPAWMGQWKQLRSLELFFCGQTQIPKFVQSFKQLAKLNFGFNKISNIPSWLWELKELRSLALNNCNLTSIHNDIGRLEQLQHLDLGGNQISSLPLGIQKLTKLRELKLGRNAISVLPNGIFSKLEKLRHLSLSNNHLQSLPNDLGKLSDIRQFDVSNNCLTSLPAPTPAFKRLNTFGFGNIGFHSLPPWIGQCPRLIHLSLKIGTFTPTLSQLSGLSRLRTLSSSYCSLSTIPGWIRSCRQLENLNLAQNDLVTLPDWIGDLSNLRSLTLDYNKIESLPKGMENLSKLTHLRLTGNKGIVLPPEFSSGHYRAKEIISYYFKTHLEAGHEPLREVKVLVVGEREVGKTSLIRHLLGEALNEAEGIVRHKMPLQCPEKGKITLNIWDFGRQEIMHSTHQFFLTERSIYLLVLDSRHNESQSRVEYWLKLIQSFGGNSPVIVVCNKCDQQPMQLNWNGLQEKYPQIKHYARRVSCFVDTERKVDRRQGLDELRDLIAQTVDKDVAHVDTPFRTEWLDLKTKLESNKNEVIQEKQFDKACAACKVDKEDRKFLLRFLHDLGLVLHFADHTLMKDSHVKDTHVLNPGWVTAAVYRLLNDHQLNQNHGRLGYEYFKQVLKTVHGHNYDGHEDFIWQMMSRFQLGFEFEKPGTTERTMLVPELLQKEEGSRGNWSASLVFVYKYTVLPQSVVSRFIVAMHHHIKPNSAWRYGAILDWNGSQARVKADLEKCTLEIQVQGNETSKIGILAVIREKLETIHRGFPGNLVAGEFAPAAPTPFTRDTGLELERIVKEGTRFQDFYAFTDVLKRISLAVCRVAVPGGGGSGFLVARDLVITNFHVIQSELSKKVPLEHVSFIFGHIRNINTGEIAPGETVKADLNWKIICRCFSPGDKTIPAEEPAPEELDYAIIRLEKNVASGPLGTTYNGETGYLKLASATAIEESQPLLIFQHPEAKPGQPQLPLQIGLGVTTRSPWPTKRTRYEVPTRRGASGSPCFDQNLQLTAIHHAGNPESKVALYNQAIPIQAIVADLNNRQEEFEKQGVAPFWHNKQP